MTTTAPELLTAESKRDQRGRRITPAARRAELVEAYRANGLTVAENAARRHHLAHARQHDSRRAGGIVEPDVPAKVGTRLDTHVASESPSGALCGRLYRH